MPMRTKEEQRAYQRKWMANRRGTWLAENGPCIRCGSWENLEVDHIDRSKKVDHKVWSWTASRREEELAKCQVLCHPCHVLKTTEFGDRPLPTHGSAGMYKTHKCRCSLCCAYKLADSRKAKAKKKLRSRQETPIL